MSSEEILSLTQAKERLDHVVKAGRTDLYKPIQIAEVLYHSRIANPVFDISDVESFRIKSKNWRKEVCTRMYGKDSTSSSRYQDDIWSDRKTAMPPSFLVLLDEENKRTSGAVEKYIYLCFQKTQKTVASIIAFAEVANPETFSLESLLSTFESVDAVKRSIDKAYEVVVYSLMETIVSGLEVSVTVVVPITKSQILEEFSDLASILLGLKAGEFEYTTQAHVYRVGVTNAADRGLDMWANFGPAIQVKHITLTPRRTKDVEKMVDHIESDRIVIVCKKADKPAIIAVLSQFAWSKRVQGILTQDDLILWYERCLRGKTADILAQPLLDRLAKEFKREFHHATDSGVIEFLEERSYTEIPSPEMWDVTL